MNAQATNLVEQTLLERMRLKESFTALDISNVLKLERYPVRHGQVAAAVRDIFQSGAMGYYDYDRKLIAVVTEGGGKKTQAFLYLHMEKREREYTARSQDSLPPVAADQARDLSDGVAGTVLPLLPRRVGRQRIQRAGRGRRDGAFAVPSALVEQLGWSAGMTLALVRDNGAMKIAPRPPISAEPDGTTLRVWGDGRVRVCRTKLRIGGLTAERVTVEMEGDGLKIVPR